MTAALTVDDQGTPPSDGDRNLLTSAAAAINDHATQIDELRAGNVGGTLTADAEGRAKIDAGFFDAATVDSAFAVATIGQELLEVELDATALANAGDAAVSPTSTQPSILVGIPIAHANHATETLVYKTTRKIEIIGLTVLKSAADAGGTVQLTDAADAAITDAVVAATDKAVTSAATIDAAKRVVAAGGTFKVVYTRGAGNSASELIVQAILRA